jgi:hypothetical protein
LKKKADSAIVAATEFSEVRYAQPRHWRADEPWVTLLSTPTTLRFIVGSRLSSGSERAATTH